jgi:hypothetical protein
MEMDAFKDGKKQEYETLKKDFEEFKLQQLEEKKRLVTEYQVITYNSCHRAL